MVVILVSHRFAMANFQYSLCRVVLMVQSAAGVDDGELRLSVLALSSRFDGLTAACRTGPSVADFQYSLCRVVLMVTSSSTAVRTSFCLSVLALSSRFDGPTIRRRIGILREQLSVLALSSRFDGR